LQADLTQMRRADPEAASLEVGVEGVLCA
jgi:hypothetical protein